MAPLINNERTSHDNEKNSNTCKKNFQDTDNQNYHRVINHCHFWI